MGSALAHIYLTKTIGIILRHPVDEYRATIALRLLWKFAVIVEKIPPNLSANHIYRTIR